MLQKKWANISQKGANISRGSVDTHSRYGGLDL